MTSAWVISMAYRDSIAMGTSAFVRARPYRLPIGSFGAPSVIGEVTSNSSLNTGNNNRNASFMHAFDFGANDYWVRVDLDRSATSETVIFQSVTLLEDDV
jgi:hypothetical protein